MDKKITQVLQMTSLWAVASIFFGFLIVNIYLAGYGFWDFNFLKVQYVSAGVLFLFLVCAPVALFYVFNEAKIVLTKYSKKSSSRIKKALIKITEVILFLGLGYISVVIFILPIATSYASVGAGFFYVFGIVWVAIVWFLTASVIRFSTERSKAQYKEINFKNILWYFEIHSKLLSFLVAVPMLILLFALILYPFIPKYYGGGKPVAVEIGLQSEFDIENLNLSNPFNALLIYQSPESVLLLTETGIYLLRQDDIEYIKYLENKKQMSFFKKYTGQSEIPTQTSTTTNTENQ